MSTTAQINANRLNAQSSTGPTSEEGKAASSQNGTTHGLCHDHTCFYFVAGEDPEKYAEIHGRRNQPWRSRNGGITLARTRRTFHALHNSRSVCAQAMPDLSFSD
jgi:hypothetical protein